MNDLLIKLARELGRKMAEHERAQLLWKAQRAVNEDTEAIALLEDYQKQAEKIQKLENENKPIEVEDKHKLREIEENISLNDKLRELTRRQVDFVEMTRKVKQTIDAELLPEQKNQAAAEVKPAS